LGPAERLSLLVSAAARGDDGEHARLMAAAPRVAWRVPHTFARTFALLVVSALHRMESLELAALLFKTSALADARGRAGARFRNAARLFGYLVKVQAEGWALFCGRAGIDPEVPGCGMPGGVVLDLASEEAGVAGFSASSALAHARRVRGEPHTLKTASSIADALQAIYEEWAVRRE